MHQRTSTVSGRRRWTRGRRRRSTVLDAVAFAFFSLLLAAAAFIGLYVLIAVLWAVSDLLA